MLQRQMVVAVAMVLFVLGAPLPASAQFWRMLAWMDELSGPGDFRGGILTGEVACGGEPLPSEIAALRELSEAIQGTGPRSDTERVALATAALTVSADIEHSRRCRYDRRNVRWAIVVEAGSWREINQNPNFVGDTRLVSLNAIAYTPPLRIIDREGNSRFTRALELGAGLGAYRLSGAAVIDRDFWRGSIPLRLRVLVPELVLSDAFLKSRDLRTRRLLQSIQFRVGLDVLPGFLAPRNFELAPGSRFDGSTREWNPSVGLGIDLGAVVWSWFEPKHKPHP